MVAVKKNVELLSEGTEPPRTVASRTAMYETRQQQTADITVTRHYGYERAHGRCEIRQTSVRLTSERAHGRCEKCVRLHTSAIRNVTVIKSEKQHYAAARLLANINSCKVRQYEASR